MNIVLNNRPEELDAASLTIADLLKIKKYTFKMLIIKVNDSLVKKDEYSTFRIREGDRVMVLHLISGG